MYGALILSCKNDETMHHFEDNFVENVKRYDSGRQFIQDVQKRLKALEVCSNR
jgi:hypothetical protein